MSDKIPRLRQAHLLAPQQLIPRKTSAIPALPGWLVWLPLIVAFVCLPGWAASLCGSVIFFMATLLGGLCSVILSILLLLFRKGRRKEALLMLFCTLILLPLSAITLLTVAVC